MKKQNADKGEIDSADKSIITDLRKAYKMIEESRKSPEHRKVKHITEQRMLIRKHIPTESDKD